MSDDAMRSLAADSANTKRMRRKAEALDVLTAKCDGSKWCGALAHVHGCYRDGGRCDDPTAHIEVETSG